MKRLLLIPAIALALISIAGACRSKREAPAQPPATPQVPPVPDIMEDMPSRVPAYPDTIWYELPDGYILRIFLRGDEHFHIALTADGFPLVMNPEGFYEYTFRDDQGLPQSTGIIARNPEDRSDEDWRVINATRP
ncbi:MAG: hypothetical protein ACK4VN_13275 [Bacteroidales bacterium]